VLPCPGVDLLQGCRGGLLLGALAAGAGAGRHVEHQLAAFEREHFDQLVREQAADSGQTALVKFGRMRWIVESRLMLVIVAVVVGMTVFVFVTM